jgi:hypothetical protein
MGILAAMAVTTLIAVSLPLDSQSASAGALVAGWYKARAEISLESSEIAGRADYKERMHRDALEQRLHIKIRHAEPDTVYAVSFNGVPLGDITTNEEGNGKLKLRTRQFIRNNDWEPFPQNFPTIVDGDVIEVGIAAGSFEVR